MQEYCTSAGARILVTGSHGLIGTEIRRRLEDAGHAPVGLDLQAPEVEALGNILDEDAVRARLVGCEGVVHLASVSRVKWGEENPDLCMRTNFDGTRALLRLTKSAGCMWFFYASSREVYGQCDRLPATEHSPIAPINVYGVSKARAEEAVTAAHCRDFCTGVGRFSNVFGGLRDHHDRVVPALMRAAIARTLIRLDGPESVFDFTFLDDVGEGMTRMLDRLRRGVSCSPVHFVSGKPTSLQELAEKCREICGCGRLEIEAPSRGYDVSRFWECGENARRLLGWTHATSLSDALRTFRDRLIRSEDDPVPY
jgi:UDP-glucose 4-epimerase